MNYTIHINDHAMLSQCSMAFTDAGVTSANTARGVLAVNLTTGNLPTVQKILHGFGFTSTVKGVYYAALRAAIPLE